MNPKTLFLVTALTAFALSTQAAVVVSDTWLDSLRTDPASPIYSEHGVDSDSDGNIESAWFNGGTAATLAPTPGHLLMTMGTGSASWTTYYTAEASPITLANAGDQLKVTWSFTPNSVNVANTSQNLRLAVVNTPSGARLAADGSPGTTNYTGYAMFMNMAQTLGNANPFRLMERTDPLAAGAFLGTSGDWAPLANGATTGNHGFDSGTNYTFTMTLTRNASSGLDIVSTMPGSSTVTQFGISMDQAKSNVFYRLFFPN